MQEFRSFTPQQEQILIDLGTVHPDAWRVEMLQLLTVKQSAAILKQLVKQLKDHRFLLQNMLAALPVRMQLSDYISRTSWPDNVVHHIAVVSEEDGVRHINLPGNDVFETILARYDTLDRLLAVADELILEATSTLDDIPDAQPIPPSVLAAIKAIPDTSKKDRDAIVAALGSGNGLISLNKHPKKDAAIICHRLQHLLTVAGLPLAVAQRKRITIRCADGQFPWYGEGPKGGKPRDNATHIATQITVKPSAPIEDWLTKHP